MGLGWMAFQLRTVLVGFGLGLAG